MKILEVKHIEDCFDGSYIKEFLLETEITESFVRHLSAGGELKYYPDFARPFFCLTKSNQYKVKGVQGNATLRTVLYESDGEETIRKLVESYEG